MYQLLVYQCFHYSIVKYICINIIHNKHMDAKIDLVVSSTDKSVKRYIVGKEKPEIVLNHLDRFESYVPHG